MTSCNNIMGEKVKITIKNSEGKELSLFFKTNNSVAVISESPSMSPDEFYNTKNTHSDQPYFLYKNIEDTLYVVWFSIDSSGLQKLCTQANIIYIWEGDFRYEKTKQYIAKDFSFFPSTTDLKQ